MIETVGTIFNFLGALGIVVVAIAIVLLVLGAIIELWRWLL